MTKTRFTVIPAVYLVLQKDGQVLLLQRQNTGYMDGSYGLPAGHHDGGQTIKEGTCREAKEEIGLDLTPDDLTFAHVMHRQANDGERVDFFFTCTNWSGTPSNTEPDKCSDLSWFPMNNLPSNITPIVAQALNSIANNIPYSEAME